MCVAALNVSTLDLTHHGADGRFSTAAAAAKMSSQFTRFVVTKTFCSMLSVSGEKNNVARTLTSLRINGYIVTVSI